MNQLSCDEIKIAEKRKRKGEKNQKRLNLNIRFLTLKKDEEKQNRNKTNKQKLKKNEETVSRAERLATPASDYRPMSLRSRGTESCLTVNAVKEKTTKQTKRSK